MRGPAICVDDPLAMPLFRDRKDAAARADEAETTAPPPPGPHLLHEGPLLAPWFVLYRLAEEIERSRRYGRPLSILIARIQLLPHETIPAQGRQAAAEAATKAARGTDMVGWLDGRRIIAVLPETDAESGRFVVSRLRDEMWLLSYAQGGQKWEIDLIDHIDRIDALLQDEGKRQAA